MNRTKLSLTIGLLALLTATSCTKDSPEDPIIPNEEEVITTLKYTLTKEGNDTAVVLMFQDLDGEGGNAPIITSGQLEKHSTYKGKLELLNELENPAEDITQEVAEEAEEHQLFFQSTLSGLAIAYDDKDMDEQPIGLATTVTTAAAGAGSITVILRHEPNKSAAGVAAGDITNAGGETDIEVTFNVEIE